MKIKEINMKDNKDSIFDRIFNSWYLNSWLYNELYLYSWLYKIRWKIEHFIKKTNWVKTNLPIGYYDIDALMEDALFSLVERYISRDGEDAFRHGTDHENKLEEIIDILHFYRVRKPDAEKKMEKLLHELYADTTWDFINKSEKKFLTRKHSDKYTKEERDLMFNEHTELEEKLDKETTEILKKCIEIRNCLWT